MCLPEGGHGFCRFTLIKVEKGEKKSGDVFGSGENTARPLKKLTEHTFILEPKGLMRSILKGQKKQHARA